MTLEELKVIVSAQTEDFNRKMNEVNSRLDGMARNADNSARRVSGLFNTISKGIKLGVIIAIGKKVAEVSKSCLELGSDLAEVQNVVDSTFKTMSRSVDSFARSASVSYGLSETMAKKYIGTFGAMATSFGFTEKQALIMSERLTALTGDVASFYNLSQDEAYTKMKAVFTGETESLKELGVVMTQTALDEYALSNGWGITTAKMDEQTKVALRYSFILDKLKTATGDFTRTQDGWANQTRILSLQIESLKANIGKGLIAVLTPAIQALNTFIGYLVKATEKFLGLLGYLGFDVGGGQDSTTIGDELKNNMTQPITDAGDGAGKINNNLKNSAKSAKKIKKALAGFDMINNLKSLNDNQDNNIKDTSVKVNTVIDDSALNNLKDRTIEIKTNFKMPKGLKEFLALLKKIKKIVKDIIDFWKTLVKKFGQGFKIGISADWKKKLQTILNDLKGIWKVFKDIITDEKVKALFKKWAKTISKNLGIILGSFGRIGLDIVSVIVGGIRDALESKKGFMRKRLIEFFKDSMKTSTILANFVKAIADIADDLVKPLRKTVKHLAGIVITTFSTAIGATMKIGNALLSAITKPITKNKKEIAKVIKSLLEPINGVLAGIDKGWTTVCNHLLKVIEKKIAPAIETIGDVIANVVGVITKTWNKTVSPVLTKIGKRFEKTFTDTLPKALNPAIDAIGDLFDAIKKFAKKLEPILKPVAEILTTVFGIIGVGVIDMFGGMLNYLLKTVGNVVRLLTKPIEAVIKLLSGDFSGALKAFGDAGNAIANIGKDTWNGLKGIVGEVADDVGEVMKNFAYGTDTGRAIIGVKTSKTKDSEGASSSFGASPSSYWKSPQFRANYGNVIVKENNKIIKSNKKLNVSIKGTDKIYKQKTNDFQTYLKKSAKTTKESNKKIVSSSVSTANKTKSAISSSGKKIQTFTETTGKKAKSNLTKPMEQVVSSYTTSGNKISKTLKSVNTDTNNVGKGIYSSFTKSFEDNTTTDFKKYTNQADTQLAKLKDKASTTGKASYTNLTDKFSNTKTDFESYTNSAKGELGKLPETVNGASIKAYKNWKSGFNKKTIKTDFGEYTTTASDQLKGFDKQVDPIGKSAYNAFKHWFAKKTKTDFSGYKNLSATSLQGNGDSSIHDKMGRVGERAYAGFSSSFGGIHEKFKGYKNKANDALNGKGKSSIQSLMNKTGANAYHGFQNYFRSYEKKDFANYKNHANDKLNGSGKNSIGELMKNTGKGGYNGFTSPFASIESQFITYKNNAVRGVESGGKKTGFVASLGKIGQDAKNAFMKPFTNKKSWDGVFDESYKNLVSALTKVKNETGSLGTQAGKLFASKLNSGIKTDIEKFNIYLATKTVNNSSSSSSKAKKNATGGIVRRATFGIVGEAGTEAILPLEHNTGWMDSLADKLTERQTSTLSTGTDGIPINITLNVGGQKFGEACIKSINKAQKRNGAIMLNI